MEDFWDFEDELSVAVSFKIFIQVIGFKLYNSVSPWKESFTENKSWLKDILWWHTVKIIYNLEAYDCWKYFEQKFS